MARSPRGLMIFSIFVVLELIARERAEQRLVEQLADCCSSQITKARKNTSEVYANSLQHKPSFDVQSKRTPTLALHRNNEIQRASKSRQDPRTSKRSSEGNPDTGKKNLVWHIFSCHCNPNNGRIPSDDHEQKRSCHVVPYEPIPLTVSQKPGIGT